MTRFILTVTLALLFPLLLSCENVLKKHILEQKAKKASTTSSLKEARELVDTSTASGDVLSHYEAIRVALVADEITNANKLGEILSKRIEKLNDHNKKNFKLLQNIKGISVRLSQEKNPEANRIIFGDLSKLIIDLYVSSKATGFSRYRCPMAKGFKDWLQPKNLKISNPYMGQRMVACGYKVSMDDNDKL